MSTGRVKAIASSWDHIRALTPLVIIRGSRKKKPTEGDGCSCARKRERDGGKRPTGSADERALAEWGEPIDDRERERDRDRKRELED